MLDKRQWAWDKYNHVLYQQMFAGEITEERMQRCLDRGRNMKYDELITLARLYGIYINYDK